MKYRAGINTSDGPAWGQVLDLPGCTATAATPELEAVLPLAAAEYLAWLRRHGEPVDLNSDIDIEIDIVERVDLTNTDAQDGEFCYDDDLRPLSDHEIALGLRLMAYAREDLLAAIDGLPAEILDWRPPKSAMAHIDPWQPEPLTIREIVSQIPASESYYRNCLKDGPIADEPASIAPRTSSAAREDNRRIQRTPARRPRTHVPSADAMGREARALDSAQIAAPDHRPRALPHRRDHPAKDVGAAGRPRIREVTDAYIPGRKRRARAGKPALRHSRSIRSLSRAAGPVPAAP